METPVVTTSSEIEQADNSCPPERSSRKGDQPENSVPDIHQVKDIKENNEIESVNNLNDKNLSWKNIASEITDDGGSEFQAISENNVQTETATSLKTDQNLDNAVPEIQTEEVSSNVDETVINIESSKEEISITEADSSDQILESSNIIPVDEVIEEPVCNEKVEETSNKVGEVIEISELKPGEGTEITETVEYTVIEAEEAETTESIAEHLAQTTTDETIIIRTEDSLDEVPAEEVNKMDESATYVEEIYILGNKDAEALDDPAEEQPEQPPKPKKPRGRKPIGDIPLHVLGRDITKPIEGVSNGGRTMPKPRLGVKVPYRNLTSQIVSKQEIEKEIMDRFKLKQEQNAANSADVMFARKLTQNLAKKLIPNEKEKSGSSSIKSDEACSSSSGTKSKTEIKNDSDLLAILEGDGDDDDVNDDDEDDLPLSREKSPVQKRETEREIALKQLRELPNSSGEESSGSKSKSSSRNRPTEETRKVQTPGRHNVKLESGKSEILKASSEKRQIEIEPRLKTGMVVKTYTRKRKSVDVDPLLLPKKVTPAPTPIKSEDGSFTNVYVTKSSRIIKKKVIWDPDEIPNKSPIRSPRQESASNKPVASKSSEKKPETKTSEKKIDSSENFPDKKPLPVKKKETSDKVVEKKSAVSPVKKMVKVTPPGKKPKRLTEVDRLLMDEGAVNMLYEVKNNDESNQDRLKKKNKSVISLDRAHRELMNKTNVIRNDLQQTVDNQKSLRKKEVTPSPKRELVSPKKDVVPSSISRKKSKDSTKSSGNSPPASPAYNLAEASRIIRRHSSSSFSSDGGGDDENYNVEKSGRKRSSSNADSIKKKIKKTNEQKNSNKDVTKNNNSVSESKVNNAEKCVGKYESFVAKKSNKVVSIVLDHTATNGYLSEKVLRELTACLKELGSDDDCHVLSLSSSGNGLFCRGLNYGSLYCADESACKKKSVEIASLVKEFLKCLLNFPKVLVAAIQGDCIGLGVTMLPLFDMIVASDTSTFSTPYATLGCLPEAGFLLTVPYLSSHGLASELFYTSQVIKADDAFRRGLVTRLCWPEKYHEELKNLLNSIASQSRQSIATTKKQLRGQILQATETSLSSINKVLVENWTSSECQKKFSKYHLDMEK